MKKKKVMFISSKGGHFVELMKLKPLFNDYDYTIVTEGKANREKLKKEYGKKINFLIYGTKSHIWSYIFIFPINIIKSLILFIKIKPKYIITTGTHTAVPMCYIGKIFGSKIIYIETFANIHRKTKAGKLVYPIADLFLVQWEQMLELYPKAIYGGPII